MAGALDVSLAVAITKIWLPIDCIWASTSARQSFSACDIVVPMVLVKKMVSYYISAHLFPVRKLQWTGTARLGAESRSRMARMKLPFQFELLSCLLYWSRFPKLSQNS